MIISLLTRGVTMHEQASRSLVHSCLMGCACNVWPLCNVDRACRQRGGHLHATDSLPGAPPRYPATLVESERERESQFQPLEQLNLRPPSPSSSSGLSASASESIPIRLLATFKCRLLMLRKHILVFSI
eukprot:scaffold4107_cov224-Skeletonema_marinoi.AAC.7